MRSIVYTSVAAMVLALPAMAQDVTGDADAGEREFRKCKACHSIEGPEETIVKGGRTGPNLYGVAGRTAGTYEDFSYSDVMAAAGEAGLAWNQEDFVGYVQDPTPWLREYTGDSKGRGKMTFKLRGEEDAMNVWAYLVSVGPEMDSEAEASDSGS